MANVPDLVVATYAQQPLWCVRRSALPKDRMMRWWKPDCPPREYTDRECFRVAGWNAAGQPLGYLVWWEQPSGYRAGCLLVLTWPGYDCEFFTSEPVQ